MKITSLALASILVAGFAFAVGAQDSSRVGQVSVGESHSKTSPRVVHFSMQEAKWEKHPEFGGAEWVIYRSPDGKRVAAAWQESGKVSFTYPFDEFVHVIKGSAKVSVHGGQTFELRVGDVAYFEEGAVVDFEFSDDFTDVTMLLSDREVKWR